jgi:hypothetical protein
VLTTQNSSGLVKSQPTDKENLTMAQEVKNIKIRIVRACIVAGEHANEGQTFDAPKDIPVADAKYLIGIGKAEAVDEIGRVATDKPAKK